MTEDGTVTTVTDSNGDMKTEGSSVKKYYYIGDSMAMTREGSSTVFTGIYDETNEIISACLGTAHDYTLYGTDMQGSTTVLLDDGLDITGRYSYSDYGEVTETQGTPSENEICYTGAVYDDTIGEHYLRARYYDPEAAVFTAQDTYRGDGVDTSQWNLYAYCDGDPINATDPTGHYSVKKAIKYAKRWWNRRNPEYEDFSLVGGGNRYYTAHSDNHIRKRIKKTNEEAYRVLNKTLRSVSDCYYPYTDSRNNCN